MATHESSSASLNSRKIPDCSSKVWNTTPLWDDFLAKAGKLHTCLRAAIQAIAAYLDAFQKIADAATNSRGASKEIGTALTRVCLRHKAVETRLKTFTSAIMDCLVLPLQDKLEDWKRQVAIIDKEHAKEYKRCRAELKKRSTDTLRLQKKARKGQSDAIQSLVDSHMQDVTLRRAELEDVEKKSLRSAMIEERMRYCTFVHMLQPVVREECEVMSELGHLQEAMQSIANVTKEPSVLPQASEELILDAKSTMNLYPESPGGGSGSQGCSNSLGSRKSSVCSISSMNSSGSGGSPGHHHYPRSLSQLISPAIRLKPGESSDSGFCSSPALTSQASTATSQSHAVSTWPPHSQDNPSTDRPHTISTAYEKGHQRPALTVYTFQNPETIMEGSTTPTTTPQKSPGNTLCRPPLPVRCSSLERPLSTNNNTRNGSTLMQRQCPSPIPAHITKELSHLPQAQPALQLHQQHSPNQQQLQQQSQIQPTYVNMSELATMAVTKLTTCQQLQQHQFQNSSQQLQQNQQPQGQQQINQQQQQQTSHQQTPLQQQQSTDSHSSISSQISSESSLINNPNHSSSNTPSLHSHTSIDSHQSNVGQTYTPSSGASTPQNHYSPLLTNSPATPLSAGAPLVIGYINPASNNNSSCSSLSLQLKDDTGEGDDVLKITETDIAINNSTTTPNEANYTHSKENCNTGNASSATDASATNPESSECDERVHASVLQKASMFEKQAAAAANSNVVPPLTGGKGNTSMSSGESSYSIRKDEVTVTKVATDHVATEKDNDKIDKLFEDSIQELNDLIGELDSFQREHEEREQTNGNTMAPQNDSQLLAHDMSRLLKDHVDDINSSSQNNSSAPASTGTNGNSGDVDSDKISIGSLNYSIHSTTASDAVKFTYSDSELSRFVSETSSMGFENPTFLHLAQSETNVDSLSIGGEDSALNQQRLSSDNDSHSGSGVVVIYDHTIPCTPDIDYVKQNSEIVVLRTKDPQTPEPSTASMTTANLPQNLLENPKQRLSSFRSEQLGPSENNNQGCGTRIARRSSVNTTKPPPPVRRSSSVTPSHNLSTPNSPNLIQQNTIYNSVESLPPPPAYLLDRQHSNSVPQTLPASSVKVAETVKALSAIRHTPASPSAIRRAQGIMNQQPQTATIQSQIHENSIYSESPSSTHDVASHVVHNNLPLSPQLKLPVYQHYQHPPSAAPLSQVYNQQQDQQQSQQDQENQQINYYSPQSIYNSYHHNCNDNQQQLNASLPHEKSTLPSSIPPPNSQTQKHHQQHITSNTISHNSCDINSSFRTTCNSPGIYAQPKQVSSMSSFRSASPSTPLQQQSHNVVQQPKANPVLIAQLNARLNKQQHQQSDYGTYQVATHNQDNNRPMANAQQHHQSLYGSSTHSSHHQQQQNHHHPQQQQQQQQSQSYNQTSTDQIYSRQYNQSQLHPHQHQSQQQQQHQQQHYDDYSSVNNEKTGSIRSKTKAEFLENLNAKLAKQGISGRAFAVRNLINSKALLYQNPNKLLRPSSQYQQQQQHQPRSSSAGEPDPRLCHESLMDQIKRGAKLKRNQKINDRSAPKIH